jgi:hypothetical protein
MSTLVVTNISDGTNSTTSTNAIRGSAKAWVNFNASSGVPTVRSSFNISTITDNGIGLYAPNFTAALTSANFVLAGTASRATAVTSATILTLYGQSTSLANISVSTDAGGLVDSLYANIAVIV